MTLRAAARLLLSLLTMLLLTGCAALTQALQPRAAASAEAASAPAPTSPPVRVEIQAPDPLDALLERHLDIVRLGTLSFGDTVDDTEWTRLIAATPTQVRELLQTEGHFAAQVQIERIADGSDREGRPAAVRVRVDPGPVATVDRITYEVQGELQEGADAGNPHAQATLAEARAGWALPFGAPFRNAAWSSAKAGVLARLRAAGYATATWTGTGAQVDAQTLKTRLFLVLDSGPLFRFGRLDIEGLAVQDAQTVRNLAAIDPGAPVTETMLLDFQERLQKAGLFDSVTVTLNPDPERAAESVVRVNLREAPIQVYTVGLGVDANTGPRLSLEHVYRRVFGWPATARNKLEWGDLRQAWNGEIGTHPGERLYRNLLGGAVERLEGTDDIVLSQRLRLGRAKDMQRIERLYFLEAERSVRTTAGTTAPEREQTLALSANYHGVWRDLDSLLLPTRGYAMALQGGVGHSRGTTSDSGPFTRAYGRLTGYLPLGGNWYGQARIEAGQVFVRSAVAIPDSQLFRAGGEDSVRGYEYRSLGPVVDGAVSGGKVLLTSSVEVAHPLLRSFPSLWGAVFVDAGRAADTFDSLDPAIGAGVGVRWRSPVGPLKLDLAWGEEVRKLRLHFSVGVAF